MTSILSIEDENEFARVLKSTLEKARMKVGLAIMRLHTKLDQGSSTAENDLERGARFRLRLPLHCPAKFLCENSSFSANGGAPPVNEK